jgi:hypothetical protein
MKLDWSGAVYTLLFLSLSWPSSGEILNLKSGDSLEGDILDETETTVTFRLLKGTTIRVLKADIENLDLDLPVPMASEEAEQSLGKTSDLNLNLHGEPTPTPIPVIPLTMRFKRVEFPQGRLGAVSSSPLGGQPFAEPPKLDKDLPGLGKPFGRAFVLQEGNKYKPYGGTWLALRNGQILLIGDQVNIIVGGAQVRTQDGASVTFSPGSAAQLLLSKTSVEKGKMWVQNTGDAPFSLSVQGVEAVLRSGAVGLEFLRSGVKLNFFEAEARILREGDGTVLSPKIEGSSSVLVGVERNLVPQGPAVPAQIQEWKDWRAAFETLAAQSTGFADTAGSVSDSTDPMVITEWNQLEKVARSIQNFHLDLKHFPREAPTVLKDLFENTGEPGWKGPYLPGLSPPLRDVWGTPLQYRLRSDPREGGAFAEVLSLGADKVSQEGKGDDQGLIVLGPQP